MCALHAHRCTRAPPEAATSIQLGAKLEVGARLRSYVIGNRLCTSSRNARSGRRAARCVLLPLQTPSDVCNARVSSCVRQVAHLGRFRGNVSAKPAARKFAARGDSLLLPSAAALASVS